MGASRIFGELTIGSWVARFRVLPPGPTRRIEIDTAARTLAITPDVDMGEAYEAFTAAMDPELASAWPPPPLVGSVD